MRFSGGAHRLPEATFPNARLEEFKWIAYSEMHEGAFCKWCVAFAPDVVSRSAKALGMMVNRQLTKIGKSERRL